MFIRNVFFTFSTEIIGLVGNILIGILLARGLTVPQRGVMVLVMTLPFTVSSFANLGIPQANIYMIGRNKWNARTVLGNSLFAALLLGLLAVGLLAVFRNQILETVLAEFPEELWFLLLALVPLLLIDVMLLSILRARQRFDLFNLRRLAASLLMLTGFFVALFVLKAGLPGVIGVYAGMSAGLVGLSLIFIRREVPVKLAYDPELTRQSIRFGSKSYLHHLVGALTYRLDIFLLALFLNAEQVAYYGVATSLAEVAWYIPDSVGTVLFPRLSNSRDEEVHQITARVNRTTLAVTVLIVLLLAASAWFIMPLLYGQAYVASIPPLLVLLPGIVAMVIYKVLTRNFTSRDKQQVSILGGMVALILNVGLNLILIPRWGVIGAASSSSVSYITAGLILLVFFLRDSGLSWQEVLLPKSKELIGHIQWAKETLQAQLQKI